MALQIYLTLDEKFEKFEHNFAELGMEMAEMHKEYTKLKTETARKEVELFGRIALLQNEVTKLREQNGILTSRLMNNAAEREQNLANIQSMVQNNDIATIKREEENVVEVGTCPGPSAEQIAPQQIIEQKQYYTINPLDELNEMPANGFGLTEEVGFDDVGDEIVAGHSMEMDGIGERMDKIYGVNPPPHEGPSNIDNMNQNDGKQIGKKKRKLLICQWPGCGYRADKNAIMQRHWRTHTGERPFCCSICGQSFARLDNMKNHELKRHNLL